MEPEPQDDAHGRDEGQKKRTANSGVFENSGMTDEHRRKLRRKQRKLHDEVANEMDRREDEEALEFLERKRGDNNKLFESVKFTREAVLDAENTELLAAKSLHQLDRLVQVPRFDATKLACKIRSKCSTGQGSSRQFNWSLIGRECGICFNALPTGVTFLAGTMDQEESFKARRARKTPQKKFNPDAVEEQRPEQVINNKGDADQLSAAEKAMKDVKKVLRKHSKSKEGDSFEVDGVKFLFNPKSFTQTVENIFHFSFLIKRAEAAIGVRTREDAETTGKPEGLWVRAVENTEGDDVQPAQTDLKQRQAVIAFNMRDWRRICESNELKQGLLKHRTGSKHAPTAMSQSA